MVRYATFAGCLLFIPFVLGLDKSPFSVSGILAGTLVIVAGVTVASDGGEAMSALSRRYLGRSNAVSHRWFGALMITVGCGWFAIGVWLTAR